MYSISFRLTEEANAQEEHLAIRRNNTDHQDKIRLLAGRSKYVPEMGQEEWEISPARTSIVILEYTSDDVKSTIWHVRGIGLTGTEME